MKRVRINVRGVVQGVGFRPFVHGLALRLGLSGHVANTAQGVVIEAQGARVHELAALINSEAPPLARIEHMQVAEIAPVLGEDAFRIEVSRPDEGGFTLISPDVAPCAKCSAELRDPADRRYGYPFINCTHCGPRYTITLRVPYDRANTTMTPFPLCPQCRAEYEDPGNRRFHAEPNACPLCGPRVEFQMGQQRACGAEAIDQAVELLRQGRIVAVKGVGGFLLACDARNEQAVNELRTRKRRKVKPFALMARDMETVQGICEVDSMAALMLGSPERPVVIMPMREGASIAPSIAPGMRELGVMLPSTPLHMLLMDEMELLVMTSGNRAEEPIQINNAEALAALAPLADAFLLHDRDIYMRVDDSVVRPVPELGHAIFIRRARGYAPRALMLMDNGPDVLAAGAEIKNTFCLARGQHAIMSQHIGDMENLETLEFFSETLANLKRTYRAQPVAIAHDMHPDYLSTRWALEQGLPCLAVQHHHAHIASVMAEHGLTGPVLGVAFDGTGYGPDSTLWGGEFLIASEQGYERAGVLRAIALPGGEAAVREPWRIGASVALALWGQERALQVMDELGICARHGHERVRNVLAIAHAGQFAPLSTGAGRLFDAASALLGICEQSTFEGHAAMALEAQCTQANATALDYAITFKSGLWRLDFLHALGHIIDKRLAGAPVGELASAFHATVADGAVDLTIRLTKKHTLKRVALSGGVLQNRILLAQMVLGLRAAGLEVYINSTVPTNDGGLALGQAYILRHAIKEGLFTP